jgi:hypothetical protein
MLSAFPSPAGRMVLVAALATLAAVFVTRQARPAETIAPAGSRVCAYESRPELASLVGRRRATQRRLASPLRTCAVFARRPIAAERLAREPSVDFVGLAPSGRPRRQGAAAIVFNGDFDTGNVSQWTGGAQCANTFSGRMLFTRGTVTVQSEIVAQGRYAARIDLPAATENTACETLTKRPIGVGTDDYYGLQFRLPSDWREPSPAGWGLAIAQLNYQGIWGTPIGLKAHADRVNLVLQSGLCRPVGTPSPPGPGCAYSNGPGGNLRRAEAVRSPMQNAVWHQLVIHVKWATDSSGVIEVWHRVKGTAAWTKTVHITGYPTLQWTADGGPEAIGSSETTDKIGAYRGQADFPLTIWHDGFVRSRSFASAAAVLP